MTRYERLAIVGILLLVVGAIVFCAVAYESAKHECEDRGGSYESYNCRTILMPMVMSCGSNCMYTVLIPQEACDYHCVGAARP